MTDDYFWEPPCLCCNLSTKNAAIQAFCYNPFDEDGDGTYMEHLDHSSSSEISVYYMGLPLLSALSGVNLLSHDLTSGVWRLQMPLNFAVSIAGYLMFTEMDIRD